MIQLGLFDEKEAAPKTGAAQEGERNLPTRSQGGKDRANPFVSGKKVLVGSEECNVRSVHGEGDRLRLWLEYDRTAGVAGPFWYVPIAWDGQAWWHAGREVRGG